MEFSGGMEDFVARFVPAPSNFVAVPNGVQIAATAGRGLVLISDRASHRAILRHAVLVFDGRCLS